MDDFQPITRVETYLAALSGEDVTPPEPTTRIEEWLDKVVDNVDNVQTEKVTTAVDAWLGDHVDPDTGYVLDDTLTLDNAAAPAGTVGELKTTVDAVVTTETITDAFGTNAAISNKYDIQTFIWTASTKTLEVPVASGEVTAQTTGWAVMTPKLTNAHDYVLVIKFNTTREVGAYCYIRNLTSNYNYNVGQKIVQGDLFSNNHEQVLKFTAENTGWLAFGFMVPANTALTYDMKISVYDVTEIDVGAVSDAEWFEFSDTKTVISGGSIVELTKKANYTYAIDANVDGEKWAGLGDSLTAAGSGGQYRAYVKAALGLAEYKDNGVGGTTISGAGSASAMWQDTRIDAISTDSDCVTVMGGTNDAWQLYYQDHPGTNMAGWGDCDRSNHDVSTFCGAYNVLISKILYKFCKVAGYYDDIDYTGLTQVTTVKDNFRLILLTPPQMYYVPGGSMSENITNNGNKMTHSLVKQIAELWGLPCVDTWEMGMNDMNKTLFFANAATDATHFNSFGHERLASLVINTAVQVSRYK